VLVGFFAFNDGKNISREFLAGIYEFFVSFAVVNFCFFGEGEPCLRFVLSAAE
jgi:hypothetical protein